MWKLEGAAMEPKPVQSPTRPSGRRQRPKGMRRAVRHGDGFFGAGSQTTAQFTEQVKMVREELARRTGTLRHFRIAKRVYIHVDDDAGPRARADGAGPRLPVRWAELVEEHRVRPT